MKYFFNLKLFNIFVNFSNKVFFIITTELNYFIQNDFAGEKYISTIAKNSFKRQIFLLLLLGNMFQLMEKRVSIGELTCY